MVTVSLSTPAQHPVVSIVGPNGDLADLSEYIPNNTFVSASERDSGLPTGGQAQTFDRAATPVVNSALLTSGRLSLYAIWIRESKIINNISFYSATTAASVPLNQWFSLYSVSTREPLAVTTDDTTTAWAATTKKTLALTTPWTCPASAYYYVGICVVATTVPTLFGMSSHSLVLGEAPILAGQSTTGLTNPASAPNPAGALSANNARAYALLS